MRMLGTGNSGSVRGIVKQAKQPTQHPLVRKFVRAAKRQGVATYSGKNFAIATGSKGRAEIRVDGPPAEQPKP